MPFKSKSEYRAWRKGFYERRKLAGVCIHCSNRAEVGHTACRECLDYQSFMWRVRSGEVVDLGTTLEERFPK
jgi:hypothetical protein